MFRAGIADVSGIANIADIADRMLRTLRWKQVDAYKVSRGCPVTVLNFEMLIYYYIILSNQVILWYKSGVAIYFALSPLGYIA